MHIDIDATEMTKEQAESLLAELYKKYHNYEPAEAFHEDSVSLLQYKGFVALAFIFDSFIHSTEMKELVDSLVTDIWQENLERDPIDDEYNLYSERLRLFGTADAKEVLSGINRAKELRKQALPFLEGRVFHEAKPLLDEAVKEPLVHWHVWHDHALVRYWQEDYEAAIPSYHNAILLNTGDSFIHSCDDLMKCYQKLAEIQENEKWLRDGIQFFRHIVEETVYPSRWIAWHAIGYLNLHAKEYEESITAYQKAIALKGDVDWTWSTVDIRKSYWESEDAKLRAEGYEYFQGLVEAYPNDWGAWHGYAYFLWKYKSELNAGAHAFQEALERYNSDPGWFWTHYHLGWCLGDLKDYTGALKQFEIAIKIEPHHARALHSAGWANEQMGQWEEAIHWFQKALNIDPNYYWSWIGLARCNSKKSPPNYVNTWEGFLTALSLAKNNKSAREGLEDAGELLNQDLKTILASNYSINELMELCFDLKVNYEELEGTTLTTKVISLINYIERRNRLLELIQKIRQLRPRALPGILEP